MRIFSYHAIYLLKLLIIADSFIRGFRNLNNNQRTNGPIDDHLIFGLGLSTISNFINVIN